MVFNCLSHEIRASQANWVANNKVFAWWSVNLGPLIGGIDCSFLIKHPFMTFSVVKGLNNPWCTDRQPKQKYKVCKQIKMPFNILRIY